MDALFLYFLAVMYFSSTTTTMEAATESEVPKGIRREIRAVLLSKQGGVPLHTFLRDYQKLTDTRLDLREMGYSSIRAFIGAIPDTARSGYLYKSTLNLLLVYFLPVPL